MSRWSTQGRAMALARTRIMRLVAGVRVLSWLPSAMILAGCSTSGVLAEAPIISSGYFGVGGFGNQSVYWLDNERVLFVGYKDRKSSARSDGPKIQLLEWNTATGQVMSRADLGTHSFLCYARGYVHYHFRNGSNVTMRAGPLGKETALSPPGPDARMNPLTCRYYDPQSIEQLVGPGLLPLRDEHGFWGRQEDKKSSVYLKRDGDSLVPIVVPMHGVVGPIGWSHLMQAYVLRRGETYLSRTGTTGKLWMLHPSGRTAEFTIPSGVWFAGSTRYGITKEGPFISSHAGRGLDIGDAGGYLMRGAIPKRLITGYIHSFEVSPDGCKVALSMRPGLNKGDLARVIAINVCKVSD